MYFFYFILLVSLILVADGQETRGKRKVSEIVYNYIIIVVLCTLLSDNNQISDINYLLKLI